MNDMRGLMALMESVTDEVSPQDVSILKDMMARAPEGWLDEVRDNGAEEDCLVDEECLLHEFAMWLRDQHSVEVENGLVTFWTLTRDVEEMIAHHPVKLYHYTSSRNVNSIRRHGLLPDRKSVNYRKTDGVYLTTEYSGPAVNGYIYKALRGNFTRHWGVRLVIRATLSELEPDPDDADISSGRHQFITDYIAPNQIIDVERT